MRNVYRTPHSWVCEIQAENHLYCQNFPFKQWGGIKKAQAAAIAHRNTLRLELGLSVAIEGVKTSRAPYAPFSPIVGISRYSSLNTNQRYSTIWCAFIQGKRQAFSAHKYGDEAAFQLACEVRFDGCGILQVKGSLPYKPTVPYEKVKVKIYAKR